MGIQQQHPDAEPPTAAEGRGGSDLPRLMEQLTRALLHVPAEQAAPPAPSATTSTAPSEVTPESADEAAAEDAAFETDVPVEDPQAEVPEVPAPPVVPPAPRRPGAVLGELAFLDE